MKASSGSGLWPMRMTGHGVASDGQLSRGPRLTGEPEEVPASPSGAGAPGAKPRRKSPALIARRMASGFRAASTSIQARPNCESQCESSVAMRGSGDGADVVLRLIDAGVGHLHRLDGPARGPDRRDAVEDVVHTEPVARRVVQHEERLAVADDLADVLRQRPVVELDAGEDR